MGEFSSQELRTKIRLDKAKGSFHKLGLVDVM